MPAATGARKITERERSCRCTGPSLPFPEGILPHRRICQANKDFPPSEVCREQEFRTDNLPLRLSWAQRSEEARLQSPPAAFPWAERVDSDCMVAAAADIPRSRLPDDWPH